MSAISLARWKSSGWMLLMLLASPTAWLGMTMPANSYLDIVRTRS
ncbi:hypothetical protein [Dyella silvatica]|nr:hypothetical protein [Dyella silvatica]